MKHHAKILAHYTLPYFKKFNFLRVVKNTHHILFIIYYYVLFFILVTCTQNWGKPVSSDHKWHLSLFYFLLRVVQSSVGWDIISFFKKKWIFIEFL